jgi:hypothetical protein
VGAFQRLRATVLSEASGRGVEVLGIEVTEVIAGTKRCWRLERQSAGVLIESCHVELTG